jgi:hypothetical protein
VSLNSRIANRGDLDDEALVVTRPTLGLAESIEERYVRWRRTEAGRVVYHDARLRALALRRAGLRHYGIAAIVEAIRYDRAVEVGRDEAGFKVNNNHRALLARELMQEPGLEGFFQVRDTR